MHLLHGQLGRRVLRRPAVTGWRARFRWTPHGYEHETQPGNPRRNPCSWCGAAPGHDCTRLTPGGRRVPIGGYHDARAPLDDQEHAANTVTLPQERTE